MPTSEESPLDLEAARAHMVRSHLRSRGINDRRVLQAMGRVPRERFLPAHLAGHAYDDCALPISCEQTISQPYIVAAMTQALQLAGGERVLEVGTGSGYQAAILAELAQEVVTIERHEPLSLRAAAVLSELGYQNVRPIVGDGGLGFAERAPFDRVIVTAAAESVPPALWEQLREGGLLVAPLGPPDSQELLVMQKVSGRPVVESITACRFVPLIRDEADGGPDTDRT